MAFWKWWTTFVLVVFGLVYAHTEVNLFYYLFELDITRLSAFIIIIFLACNIYLSYLTFMSQFYREYYWENDFKPLWFWSDAVLNIGMIGTLIGFMFVLMSAFGSIDTTSTDELKEIIIQVSHGMGIAIVTTLTGSIASLILKAQILMLEMENEKL